MKSESREKKRNKLLKFKPKNDKKKERKKSLRDKRKQKNG